MPNPEVHLPTLHEGQIEVFQNADRLNVVRCGRRWGKTKMMVTLAADGAAKGKKVGLFTPEHRQLYEPYGELLWILRDIKTEANKSIGVIKTSTNGQIDFWSLNDNELAGRGREYDLVMIDEAAFTKDSQMYGIWEKSINPTMLTRPKARVWVFSTPCGNSTENFFWRICHGDTKFVFKEHYAPTSTNPYVPPQELEREKEINHPQVFLQEFLAQFVDWSGDDFFDEQKMLVDGKPVEYPKLCDGVFAVIDTAMKTGTKNDGTGVSYWAVGTKVSNTQWFGHPLICLDWDYVQVEGAMLEQWIPGVFVRTEELARICGARAGSRGAYIEDAQSGSILLQQCKKRGLPAHPLPAKLTAAGKDGRAINASGPVYQGQVKWSIHAFDHASTFKGSYRNHMRSQIKAFRPGDKDAATRADDLLDTFTYAVAITLGNNKGWA